MEKIEKRKISVFIASPGDLDKERQSFKKAIDILNVGFGDGAKVEFEALGWEDTLACTGRRAQGVINAEIDRCDVFILAMHRLWGQDAPDAKPYMSYTEEEFHRALERWKKEGKPEIFVFFKRVDAASEADAGPQLEKVLAFRRHLEETRRVLYRRFNDENSFMDEVGNHLRAYVKGELPEAGKQNDAVVLPLAALEKVEEAKKIAEQKTKEAEKARDDEKAACLKAETLELQIAEVAADFSKEGKIEFARQKFVKLAVESENLRVLYLSYEFFYRTGDLNSAMQVLEKWLTLCGPDSNTPEAAIALSNLGNLYQTRGELDRAEEMYRKSLAIDEVLGCKEGMASNCGNLGVLYKTRGELDRAEEMYWKSLVINEALGRKEGMAGNYGNLGILCQIRGELDQAEDVYLKVLAIEEAIGRKEGMAKAYGNLGNLYWTRGELKRAEDVYRKSLAINEALGRKEGMAITYCSLGNLYQARGELDRAEEMYRKSLVINEALGRNEGLANNYCNLGALYQTRGELERAEEMHRESLAISEALGHKEGMADVYGNLGALYYTRGEWGYAEEMYQKALAINEAMSHKEGMAGNYCNFGILHQVRGELERAEEMYQKSLRLSTELKMPLAKKVSGLLEKLRSEGVKS